MNASTFKPGFLVWILVTIIPLTLIATYTLTVLLNHGVRRTVPYISDTIDFSPESCIGTFFISISAFIVFIIVILKYTLLNINVNKNCNINEILFDENENEKKRKRGIVLNRVSTFFGIICSISIHGVSSFQYHNTPIVHQLFAASFFFSGFIYLFTQTYLDHKFSNLPKRILILRRFIILTTSVFIGYIILQFFIDDLAAIFEIISAMSIFLYLISFYHEFSKITINFHFNLVSEIEQHKQYNENSALLVSQ
ncbi:hypothetical protein RB653_010479 [Dictyostelium firmibasis]|uniref:CWH43-like N-terminal domain-containing protein n=1 Tax=Dictyostelium firmibasis TaxID=79012 RepID=A0AAN7U1M7_9MYCE